MKNFPPFFLLLFAIALFFIASFFSSTTETEAVKKSKPLDLKDSVGMDLTNSDPSSHIENG